MMDLVARAKAGDNSAMVELFKLFTPLVIKNVRSRYVVGYEEKDLKQIGYISIMKAVRFFDLKKEEAFKVSSFKAYIKNAVVNNYNCLVRDKHKDNFVTSLNIKIRDDSEVEELLVDDMNIEQRYLEKELAEEQKLLAEKILSNLSEKDRELLEFIYIKGESIRKYAELADLKYSTCLKRKLRLLERLRIMYKAYEGLIRKA